MLPTDLDFAHGAAILTLLGGWLGYSILLALLGRRSLNSQLEVVRRQWMLAVTQRTAKPFDAILLGQIIHSVAFFGSATLIVLAGLFSAVVSLEGIHRTAMSLHFVKEISLELFSLQYGLLALVIGACFFSFTYAIRKLIYLLALIGALPEKSPDDGSAELLVDQAAIVLSEAVKTFNFGIRGYYYAVASLFLFVSPAASIVATLVATGMLLFRQSATKTSRAIQSYVETAQRAGDAARK